MNRSSSMSCQWNDRTSFLFLLRWHKIFSRKWTIDYIIIFPLYGIKSRGMSRASSYVWHNRKKLFYIFICKWWSFERVHTLSQPNIYSVNRMHNLLMLNCVFYSYLFDWYTITNWTNGKNFNKMMNHHLLTIRMQQKLQTRRVTVCLSIYRRYLDL